ncbi:hypothetical protein E2C01_075909 [Portunus trituberculatus]|uniref:Uncharacterized protein n=1 Tax=Portunus trituberculatus TaxID=210409 RepID=A0A5B7IBW4_PORTR|nr:hypothetical protein [Portunus trituberculatus]
MGDADALQCKKWLTGSTAGDFPPTPEAYTAPLTVLNTQECVDKLKQETVISKITKKKKKNRPYH